MRSTSDILYAACKAKTDIAQMDEEARNNALRTIAAHLRTRSAELLAANADDVEASREALGAVMLDRLILTPARVEAMARGIEEVAALPDPLARTLRETVRNDGLRIRRVSVPLGVVAIIYESRPNVTADAAALCLKSGNVCVLRSGKEAHRSAAAIVAVMRDALASVGYNSDCINLVEDTSRASATELMEAKGLVDLLIPRGGAGLIRACVQNATVPCIETGTGICHIYVDSAADLDKALDIVENAKTSRPSVCNAEEVLLVARSVADGFLPLLRERLCVQTPAHPAVELRCDARAAKILGLPVGKPEDFDTEFLDYILAVGIVEDVDEAIAHIAAHSTHHSDAIVTEDEAAAARFCAQVDSAAVYVNASTRFTDGGEFGLGCEMGISTQKLHARGPMGLEELTTYKYLVVGNGHVRQ